MEIQLCTVRDKEKRSVQVPHVYSLVVHYVTIVTSTYNSTHVVVCWLPSNHFFNPKICLCWEVEYPPALGWDFCTFLLQWPYFIVRLMQPKNICSNCQDCLRSSPWWWCHASLTAVRHHKRVSKCSHLMVSGTSETCSLHGWILVYTVPGRCQRVGLDNMAKNMISIVFSISIFITVCNLLPIWRVSWWWLEPEETRGFIEL